MPKYVLTRTASITVSETQAIVADSLDDACGVLDGREWEPHIDPFDLAWQDDEEITVQCPFGCPYELDVRTQSMIGPRAGPRFCMAEGCDAYGCAKHLPQCPRCGAIYCPAHTHLHACGPVAAKEPGDAPVSD